MSVTKGSDAYLNKVARSAATHGSASQIAELTARPDTAAVPEAFDCRGRFGPLPSVLRRPPLAEEKAGRARRADNGGDTRATFLGWRTSLLLLAAGLALALTAAFAQQQSAAPKPAPTKSAPAAKQPPQQQQQAQQNLPISTEQALYLIRSTLLTLNDANRSGNYTVLRDLAAPDFQVRNTAADLSQIFPTCGVVISIFTARLCWRHNSPPCRHSIKEASCIWPVCFRPGRSRSISICCLRTWPISGGCSVLPSIRRTRRWLEGDALQTRDRRELSVCKGPGSAAHHFMLCCARDTHAVGENL
jgi:hypothetical protein